MKYRRIKNNLRALKPEKKPDVYVFSYGGCGTRTFFEFLRARKNLNTQSHVHHGRIEDLPPESKALYLYGDPRDAVLSFLGRQEKDDPTFVRRHLENLDVSCREATSLESYLKGGRDVFELEAHFRKYVYNDGRCCELLVVRFETIWDHLEEVLEYVGIANKMNEFPAQRERRSQQDALSAADRERLNAYMKSLIELQASTPPVWHQKRR